MPGLSSKEATRIEEGLHIESTLVAKYGTLAAQVSNPQCRDLLLGLQSLHREHFGTLLRQVDAAASVLRAGGAGQRSPGWASGGQSTTGEAPGATGYPVSVS